ncbi:hypothetical protein OVA14_05965 [Agrococcus sp. SL85]|uniref:hypothetical protein n=1 Tax=Agrococcus sp. SL85 TaxID=2995141 RepID=UPI00226D24B7|nr:hypothetical protein [Agrococcus sp. SL85]WAC67282.1 hypothetical protein OVA14_05965 [Agrococcus sp. SL85]
MADSRDDDRAEGRAPGDAHEVEVRVRRTPKYGVFMAIGALLGAVAAWLLAAAMGPGVDEAGQPVDTNPVIGLSVVVGFVVGAGIGGVVAVLVDRSLAKRSRTLVAEHVVVEEVVEAEAVEEPAAQVEGSFERVEPSPADDREQADPDRPREG